MNLKTPTKTRSWSSLRFTLFVQVALLVSLTVFLMVVTAFLLAGNEIRRNTYDQLRSLVSGRESLIETLLTRQREQVSVVAEQGIETESDTIRRLLGFESLLQVSATGAIQVMNGLDISNEVTDAVEQYEGFDSSVLIPVITQDGFTRYIIMTPIRGDAQRNGNLAAVFDARILLSSLFNAPDETQQVSLVIGHEGDVLLFTGNEGTLASSMVYIGHRDDTSQNLAQRAVRGDEFESEGQDYAHIRVFAASRSIPSVGWGLLATVDRYQTYAPIWRLALAMFGGGLVIVLLSIVIVGSMAHRITSPLLSLKQKISNLETKKWRFERTVFTGNELEIVDQATFDLTKRLKESYDNLEERVRARTQEVLEKNAQDDAIFRSLQYGLLVTDQKGSVILLNDAGSQLTGWSNEEVKNAAFGGILALQTKEKSALALPEHPVSQALATRQSVVPILDPGYSIVRKDGKAAPIFVTTAPIMQNDACIGAIALFRDVTEDRRIDQVKSQFISLASHQLRTPLSSIRWHIEMLLGGDAGILDDETKKSMEEVGAANDRMIRMVTSLLHVANLELGTFTVHADQPVDIAELIRKTEKLFQFECKTRSVHLCEDFATNSNFMRNTDPELLGIILQNILSNAIKYSHEKSGVTIRVQEKDTHLVIVIEDHGIGIPKKDQAKIFEKLFRADNAREVDTDGNGLGLYISKIAADALNVGIQLESEEGKGTTFTLIV